MIFQCIFLVLKNAMFFAMICTLKNAKNTSDFFVFKKVIFDVKNKHFLLAFFETIKRQKPLYIRDYAIF